ncbi:MAG: response regulator [Oscillospiraceae bacterium]|nr:response regulator [Oscillospiraceae bacterium]
MKKRQMSVTTQAVIIISALLLMANVLLGSALLNRSKATMKTLINLRMLDIATTSADMIDGDELERLTVESIGNPAFQAIYDALKVFQDNINLEYIYTVRDMGDGTFTFLVDPAEEDPGEFGGIVMPTDALRIAARGVAAVDLEPYVDAWGKFYSAYSPVFDSAGNVAGIVAVDFRADWYEEQIANYANTVLLFSIFSLFVGGMVMFVITSKLRKRLHDLNSELTGLTRDVDGLMKELAIGSENKDIFLSADAIPETGQHTDEMLEIGKTIRAIRKHLRQYLDNTYARANSMINALSSDYRGIYYVNLDTDEGTCYRTHSHLDDGLREGELFAFSTVFKRYANRYVTENYREAFLRVIDPETIRRELEQEPILTLRYIVLRDGYESYEMLRMAAARQSDGQIHAVGVGFADVDRETRKALSEQQALSDALASAEEANKAKTAFLSSMSHEIRTPMNAIIGLGSIALNDRNLSASTRIYLEKIGVSAQHLLNLINDILDMSRIESGQMILKREEFSFPALLEQINAMFDSQCREKGLSYHCHVVGEVGDYYIGDDMKLKQVIINILGNAVKFTPKGGSVTLTVERTAHFDGKSALRFTVKDTGIGMDKAFLPKLFQTFTQEDASTTNQYGSTGIGLAITKNIVDMMNGTIEVDSEKGAGSTFTVSVALPDAHHEASDTDFQLTGLNVLVIDDDPIARQHAQLTLEQVGIRAEVAASGAEGVEMVRLRHARREPYDLILIDWKMPGMDGPETTKEIRSIAGVESAVIILTAYNWNDVAEEAVNIGVNSFISKPLATANILDEFRRAVKRRDAEAAKAKKADLTGRRILLAEDMPINAEIMMDILDMREMSVDHAENGRIAVDMFASQPEGYYDAILMDMRMPEMDGLAASAAIRGMNRADAKTIPIIAVTANAFNEDVQRSLQAGLNAHLSKPVDPELLFSTLESLLS